MLRVSDLTVRYPGRSLPAVSHFSLSLGQGERVLLLGPSGSGKTTLALALSGLIPHVLPAEVTGTVVVNDIDVRAAAPAALAHEIGLVFQDPDTQICMPTVEQEVAFGLENLAVPPAAMDPRIGAALDAVGMAARRAVRVDRLSGGQRQRLVLASVLAMSAPILVLDEPTAHLDPRGAREFFAALNRLRPSGCLLIEHRLDYAMSFATRVVAMDAAGEVLADGDPRTIFGETADLLEDFGIWLPPATRVARAAGLAEPMLTLDDLVAFTKDRPAVANKVLAALPVPRLPASSEPPAVVVRGLSHTYPGGANALRDVDLGVPLGDFVALVGSNGSGKTTLALHLAGILRPEPGRVSVLGRDVARTPAREVAETIGYVFQNPEHQFVTDTVLDEVRYTLHTRGLAGEEARARALETLRQFGLADLAAEHPYRLSQGEKRRLSVATVLVDAPRVLVLDEPTFGQDARTGRELLTEMVRLNERGLTIIMVTHDMDAVWEFARSTAIVNEGRITHYGPVADLPRHREQVHDAGLELPFAVRCREAIAPAGPVVA